MAITGTRSAKPSTTTAKKAEEETVPEQASSGEMTEPYPRVLQVTRGDTTYVAPVIFDGFHPNDSEGDNYHTLDL